MRAGKNVQYLILLAPLSIDSFSPLYTLWKGFSRNLFSCCCCNQGKVGMERKCILSSLICYQVLHCGPFGTITDCYSIIYYRFSSYCCFCWWAIAIRETVFLRSMRRTSVTAQSFYVTCIASCVPNGIVVRLPRKKCHWGERGGKVCGMEAGRTWNVSFSLSHYTCSSW